MFGGRFSHTRFSLRDSIAVDISINIFFIENFKGLISFGENTPAELNLRCIIDNRITGTRGFLFYNNFSESINTKIKGVKNYKIVTSYNESILNNLLISSNILVFPQYREHINSMIFASLNTPMFESFIENIRTSLFIGKNIFFSAGFREAVFALLNIEIVDKDTIVITVSIPPNGELRINSENYIVTLDGKNIIHQHSGDWAFIERGTINMAILTGGGELEGKLLYIERYL